MRFCSRCSSPNVERTIPFGDVGLRYVCRGCGFVHYERHSIVAGCVATLGERVLICQRNIEPGRGLWTIPAGYVERGETLAEAAVRETWEEAGTHPAKLSLFAIYNLPAFGEIYVIYRADLTSEHLEPGPESRAAVLVAREAIPWDLLAFPTAREALRSWSVGQASDVVATSNFFWGPEGGVRVCRDFPADLLAPR
jgi:ADP-ribose pyrophosphatase YjhB (NUDIX family)